MRNNQLSEQKILSIVDEILKRREFREDGRQNPIAKLAGSIWDAIKEWVRQIFQKNQPQREIQFNPNLYSDGFQTILRILLLLIISVLLFLLIRLIIKRVYLPIKVKKRQIPKVYDYMDNPDEVMIRFKNLLSEKAYTNAFRFLFIAMLLELHRRKVIRIEKWKTNRIYIREINMNNKDLTSHMQDFSTLFNACCYGNKVIDEESVNIWFDFYMELRERPI